MLLVLALGGCTHFPQKKNKSEEAESRVVMRIVRNNYLLENVKNETSYFLVGSYGQNPISEFLPPSGCGEDKTVPCMNWSSYYIYEVTPVSSSELKKTIRLALFSHAGMPGIENQSYLIETKKLSVSDANTVGADYLAIKIVTVGSDWSCVATAFKLDQWLYKPSQYPRLKKNEKGEYCYY